MVDIVAAVNTPNGSGVTDIDVHESAADLFPSTTWHSVIDFVATVHTPDNLVSSALDLLEATLHVDPATLSRAIPVSDFSLEDVVGSVYSPDPVSVITN